MGRQHNIKDIFLNRLLKKYILKVGGGQKRLLIFGLNDYINKHFIKELSLVSKSLITFYGYLQNDKNIMISQFKVILFLV